jgi:hypothetical protein
MSVFTSFAEPIKKLLTTIVSSPVLHAKWLNTLSFLENCGARKIAACEHPTLVKEEMLKHAAEEFRHAHYLKRQIIKLPYPHLDTYSLPHLLGGISTLQYLASLDLKTSRYLKSLGFSKSSIRESAYLLVTYAIELRAEELYPLYHTILRSSGCPITVKSILLEEKEHLNEMREGLQKLPSGLLHAKHICAIEGVLCKNWLDSIAKNVKL